MREILFRAKLKDWKTNPDHNKWVEGFYLKRKETTYCFAEDYEKYPVKTLHFIAVDEMTDWGLPNYFRLYEIDPDTLCEYTGMTDKEDNMIWENDFVEINNDVKEIFEIDNGHVHYLGGTYLIGNGQGHPNSLMAICDIYYRLRGKVIGNIFNNPELLESK